MSIHPSARLCITQSLCTYYVPGRGRGHSHHLGSPSWCLLGVCSLLGRRVLSKKVQEKTDHCKL